MKKWYANYLNIKDPEQQLDELLDPQVEEAYHDFLAVVAQVPGAALRQALDDAASQLAMLRGELGFVAGLNAALDPRPWLLKSEAEREARGADQDDDDEIRIVIDPTGYKPKGPYDADVV